MERTKDMTGNVFGKLTCIKKTSVDKFRRSHWLCVCECGNQIIVNGCSLRNGNTKSCGCLQKEKAVTTCKSRTIHGMAKFSSSGVYKSWSHMKQRCLNETNKNFPYYGGRGIKLCDEWMDFNNFYQWALENGFKKGLSIERIDVNGNYEPSNCKWATKKEQANNKRNNKRLSFNGQEKTLGEWATVLNIKYSTLTDRFKRGWSIEKTFTTPPRAKRN